MYYLILNKLSLSILNAVLSDTHNMSVKYLKMHYKYIWNTLFLPLSSVRCYLVGVNRKWWLEKWWLDLVLIKYWFSSGLLWKVTGENKEVVCISKHIEECHLSTHDRENLVLYTKYYCIQCSIQKKPRECLTAFAQKLFCRSAV